jgi:hypothetical protein
MMVILFGMNMQFNFFEEISSSRSKTAANKYLKESWRESYMTKVAYPKPLMRGNQQKPVRETLSPEGSSKGKWYDVREWQGTGPKQTETFQIPSYLWMIDWNTLPRGGSPALFSIKVYSADGKFIGSAAKAGGKGIDRAFMNNSGDYYLVIETNQKYSVSVRAQQK